MDVLELLSTIEILYKSWGYIIVFTASFLEILPIGWAIPGGTILTIGGFLSFGSNKLLLTTLLSGWFGAWATFILAYMVGKKTGPWLIEKLNQKKNALKARALLKRRGGVVLTTSLISNLLRFWVAYIAGTQEYELLKFLIYSAIASLSWSSLMVIIGFIAGSQRHSIEKTIVTSGGIAWFIVITIFILLYLIIKKALKEIAEEENNSV